MSQGGGIRHRIEYALLRLAGGVDRLLGPRVSEALAAALGRLAYRLGLRATVVDDQLRHAFPDEDEAWRRAIALESYAHLGREAMAILRLSRLGPEDVVAATEAHGLESLDQGLEEAGTGAIIVTGHFGNWEIAGANVATRGYPLDVVARRQRNRLVDRWMREMRERLGIRVIYTGGATRSVLASLQEGRSVALVADQDARSRGVFVPFFGRLASTHRGPALLALRSGAPLYIGFAVRRPDGGYRGEIRRVPIPEGTSEAQVEEVTATLTAALEAVVREAPGQYFWQHRRWKTPPPERDEGSGGYEGGNTGTEKREASTT
jgi:KDO2-lipid IV(A) lauroyltransferase